MKRLQTIRLPKWLDVLWLILLSGYIMAGIQSVPLHGDETTQTYMSRDFYALIQGDFSNLTYRDWDSLDGQSATQQDLRLKDGVLHRYLFGASAYLGGYTVDNLNEQWVWSAGWDWNHENGHVPSDDLLFRARFVSAGLLALGCVVFYFIATNTGGRFPAYVATFLYTMNPALLLNGRRAMMEGAMTCFTLLVVLAGILIIKSGKWWSYALLGLFSGVAVASKHTSIVTVLAVFLALFIIILRYVNEESEKTEIIIQRFSALFMAGILSLMIFYALNPAWWSNPIARASEVSDIRLNFIEAQRETFGEYENFGEQAKGFFWQTFGLRNMYTETEIDNFTENLADDIAEYETSIFSGFINNGNIILPMIYLALATVGFVLMVLDSRASFELRILLGLWVVAMIVLTLVLTPLEWQRYYLPAYPPMMLMTAFGINRIVIAVHYRNVNQTQ